MDSSIFLFHEHYESLEAAKKAASSASLSPNWSGVKVAVFKKDPAGHDLGRYSVRATLSFADIAECFYINGIEYKD